MYFTQTEAKDLLNTIARYFLNCEILFDMISKWYSRKTLKGLKVTKNYEAPPMPFGLNYKYWRMFVDSLDGLKIREKLTYTDVFPERMRPFSYLRNIKYMRDNMTPWMVQLYK